jgi:hypothetical protein
MRMLFSRETGNPVQYLSNATLEPILPIATVLWLRLVLFGRPAMRTQLRTMPEKRASSGTSGPIPNSH